MWETLTELSIVLVHGITGNSITTWTHNDGTLWPQHLLPSDFPKARVMIFGYDASITKLFGQSSTNTLRDHGRALCTDLTMLRLRTDSVCYHAQPKVHELNVTQNDRDLVFIAHGMGGLVCEQVFYTDPLLYDSTC